MYGKLQASRAGIDVHRLDRRALRVALANGELDGEGKFLRFLLRRLERVHQGGDGGKHAPKTRNFYRI